MTAGPIELETRVAAPPEIVFAYFVQPELYRRWKGSTAELDARPGGLYRVTMPTGQIALGRVRGCGTTFARDLNVGLGR